MADIYRPVGFSGEAMVEITGSKRGARTREEILAAAGRLFSGHGYHGTTMSDLLDGTGLTKGAFYHHFRSKEELALALLEQARNEWQRQVVGPALERQDARERVMALLERSASADRSVRSSFQLLAILAAELTEENGRLWEAAREFHEAALDVWRRVIAEGQAQGRVRAIQPAETLARWIVAGLAGARLVDKLVVAPHAAAWAVDGGEQLLFE